MPILVHSYLQPSFLLADKFLCNQDKYSTAGVISCDDLVKFVSGSEVKDDRVIMLKVRNKLTVIAKILKTAR